MSGPADDITIPGWTPGADVRAAEQQVLGAAITSRPGADEATDRLRAEDFALPAHQIIFETVNALLADGSPITPTAVMNALTRRDMLAKVGAGPYLATLVERACLPLQVGWYAEIIVRDWQRRTAAETSVRLAQRTGNPEFDPDADLDDTRAELDAIVTRSASGEAVWARDTIDGVIDRLEKPDTDPGIPTGFMDLTGLLAGLRPGQLIVIAGRPGAGKSLLAMGIAAHVALYEGLPVSVNTLEMSHDEVMLRIISSYGRVFLRRLLPQYADDLTDEDWSAVAKVRAQVKNSGLLIDDTPAVGLAQVRARLRDMARTTPARLAVVDYLQLMEEGGRPENRQVEVARFSRGLKKLAKEFNIPIIAVAQLNRGPEGRTDRKPIVSDLRESGAIEQDADIVILIHREDMYEKESPRAGEADLIVGKHRSGPTATVTVAFQGHFARFVDMAPEHPEPGLRVVDEEAS